jgi:hypothetical protein
MQSTRQDFAENYRNLSGEEISALYAQIDTLTDAARTALVTEIQQRKLTEAQLQKLHAVELRHEAQFDRLEKYRRKKLAWGPLSPNDLKGWIVAILVILVYVLVKSLIAHHHH